MQALVLDRAHAVLLDDGQVPSCPLDSGARPLRTLLAHFANRGLVLPSPAGSCPRADGGRDFVFVVDRGPAPLGMSWRPLREVSADDALWRLYVTCVLGGWEPPTRAIDVWSFGNEPQMASQLAHLVVCGEKRATIAWIAAALADGSPLAYVGGVSVVTDALGYPRVVVRTVEVREVAFDDIDAATAAAEGEGDLSYGDWRENHLAYFHAEAASHGLAFDPSARISVERFEVLHVVGRRS
jgi:uncharacterized protein YhfF